MSKYGGIARRLKSGAILVRGKKNIAAWNKKAAVNKARRKSGGGGGG